MRRVKKLFRATIALLFGLPLIIIGIILIPLPGPGVLITLLGLLILSFGFDSAKSLLERYKRKLIAIYHSAKSRHDEFIKKHDL